MRINENDFVCIHQKIKLESDGWFEGVKALWGLCLYKNVQNSFNQFVMVLCSLHQHFCGQIPSTRHQGSHDGHPYCRRQHSEDQCPREWRPGTD